MLLLASPLEGKAALDVGQVVLAPRFQDCLAYGTADESPLSISRTRLLQTEHGWELDAEFDLDGVWNGALVYGRADARFVGLLLGGDDGYRVAPFSAETW